MKRLPSTSTDEFLFSHALVALLRVRMDPSFQKNKVYIRVMKRMVHIFCQSVERGIESQLLTDCPQPSLSEKYHPFLKKSRMRGSKALCMSLVNRFQCRGGGYVTGTTGDTSLRALGINDESSFGHRSALEYCARLLCKTVTFMEKYHGHSRNTKDINICFDLASISTEHVTWMLHQSLLVDYT